MILNDESDVRLIAFFPDGMTLASVNAEGTVKLWDARSGRELTSFREAKKITALSFMTDKRRLACILEDRTIKFYFAATDEEINKQMPSN